MLNSKFFKSRRKLLAKEMKNNSIFILFQKDINIKGDSEYYNFSDSNFFYLTGIEQENTKLIIDKDSKGKVNEYFFIEKINEIKQKFEGKKLSKKKLFSISGINQKNIFYDNKFKNFIKKKNIYHYKQQKFTKELSEYEIFINNLKNKNLIEINSILTKLREIKTKEEILEMKKAMKITKIVFVEVMKNLKSLNNEAEIEAIINYHYTKNFGRHAYHPIIASGLNSCTLHYIKNNDKLKGLVLIDSGNEKNNYKTDISRTYPVNGKFTKRQKEVYEAVLLIQKFAMKSIHVGLDKIEWEKKVAYFAADVCVSLKLFTKKQFEKNKKILSNYYPHSTGHFLGLDTHDLGDYRGKFKEGQVITVEPGIYIEKEKIGIRIEDNVLIKKNGIENLSKEIPKEINEIERLIKN